jgi:hypothetical protein
MPFSHLIQQGELRLFTMVEVSLGRILALILDIGVSQIYSLAMKRRLPKESR